MTIRRTFKHPSDFIKAHQNEATKEYLVYDGSGRMIATYVALVDTENTGPCLKTTYAYDGTSTRISNRKETLDVWNSAWDI